MKRLLLSLALLVTTVSTLAANDHTVVLVSIDGLAATYFDDPKTPIPTLRQLAKDGAFAKGMITAFPSVTWPSHVSMITGVWPAKHGIIGNSVIDRKTAEQIVYIGDPVFTKDECVKVPTIYDAVHAAGGKSAAIIWPAINGAKALTWAIPDTNLQKLHDRFTLPTNFNAELNAANLSIAKLGTWGWDHKYASMRDATYTQVATYLIKKYRPQLLLVHLITPDSFEHDFGPAGEEAYWACGDSDHRVREIWEALQTPELKDRSTLFVVSDHGFAEFTKLVQPNVLFKQLGLIAADTDGKITKRAAWSHSSGGCASIYILDDARREELRKQLKESLAELSGVDRVLDVADFMKHGLPDPKVNPEQADLMLSATPGFNFTNDHKSNDLVIPADGRKGAHGHLPNQRFMHASFLAAGAGIKPGARLDEIRVVDLAPTMAKLLGVTLPNVDGRVLTEVLANP